MFKFSLIQLVLLVLSLQICFVNLILFFWFVWMKIVITLPGGGDVSRWLDFSKQGRTSPLCIVSTMNRLVGLPCSHLPCELSWNSVLLRHKGRSWHDLSSCGFRILLLCFACFLFTGPVSLIRIQKSYKAIFGKRRFANCHKKKLSWVLPWILVFSFFLFFLSSLNTWDAFLLLDGSMKYRSTSDGIVLEVS